MVSHQQPDSIDSSESPTVTKKRAIPRVFKLLFAAAAAAIVVYVVVLRRSNLEWYVSPPIDAQGRRIHVLVPVGWTSDVDSRDGQEVWARSEVTGRRVVHLSPNYERQETTVQKWLTKLHLVSLDEPFAYVTLEVDYDINREWSDFKAMGLVTDGKVHTVTSGPPTCHWMGRAISIRQTNKQASVVYQIYQPDHDYTAMANAICRSMYIE